MKKVLIIVGIVVVALIAFLVFKPSPQPEIINADQADEAVEAEALKPWAVTVGVYDPEPEPNKLTKLLESRLKELGFKTVIIQNLVDPAAAEQEKTTLLFRANTQEALEVVIDKVIATGVLRKGENEAIIEDVVIAAWSLEDINWGSFSDLAEKYDNPPPEEVTVLVLNAGAEEGLASKFTTLLKEEGYTQAEAANAEEELEEPQPILIYYQRNYKNTAKKIRRVLLDYDYTDGVSYRSDPAQEQNIKIVLTALKPEAEDTGLELGIEEPEATEE